MPKLLILNYHVSLPPASVVPSRYPNPLDRVSHRALWYADENDVIVSPAVLDRDMFEYVARMLNFDPATVTILECGRKLYDDVLLDADLLVELRAQMAKHDSWSVMPCNVTEGVVELSRRLGIDAGDEVGFASEGGVDLLNRKSHFRQLAVAHGVPLAPGVVARSPERLSQAVKELLGITGTVILKQDNAAGGAGNIALTSGPLRPLPGVYETRHVPEDLAAMTECWTELTTAQEPVLVVESYHDADFAFYFEYFVGDGGRVTFLANGEIKRRVSQRNDSAEWEWVGLEIPADVPAFTIAEALSQSAIFVAAIASMGYRGYLNVDAIVDGDGRLIFNEVNVRWGGGLVLHTIGARLLGPRYADRYVISSVRNVKPSSLPATLEGLRRHDLAFSPGADEGVVVVAVDPAGSNDTECLVLAATRSRISELETMLRQAVSELSVAGSLS